MSNLLNVLLALVMLALIVGGAFITTGPSYMWFVIPAWALGGTIGLRLSSTEHLNKRSKG
jgi:hypothetical protein